MDSSTESGTTEFRRLLPRIALTHEQFKLAQNGKVYGVSDLSAQGMGLRLLDPSDGHLFSLGAEISGTLNLRGEKVPVTAQVRHWSAGNVGCEFRNISKDLAARLARFLDPANLGRELHLTPSSEPGTLWYHGPSGADLLLKRAPRGKFVQVSLFVLGRYVQWNNTQGLETGTHQLAHGLPWGAQRASELGLVHFETLALKPDARVDSEKMRIAKTVISSSNLPEDLKKWCKAVLK